MAFCYVEFLKKGRGNTFKSDGVTAVPVGWLLQIPGGERFCFYPKKITDGPELARNNVPPDPTSFVTHKIRDYKDGDLKTFDTYDEAYTAVSGDESSRENNAKNKKKRTAASDILNIEELTSDEDNDNDVNDRLQMAPKRDKVVTPELVMVDEMKDDEPEPRGPNTSTPKKSTARVIDPIPGSSNATPDFSVIDAETVASIISNDSLKELKCQVGSLFCMMQENKEYLELIIKHFNIPTDASVSSVLSFLQRDSVDDVMKLPCQSEDDLINLNKLLLDNPELCEALCVRLSKCSVKTPEYTVYAMMSCLMTNNLGTKYNFQGRRGKEGVEHMKVIKVMQRALDLTRHKSTTNEVFKQSVSSWLKNAPKRNKDDLTRGAAKVLQALEQQDK